MIQSIQRELERRRIESLDADARTEWQRGCQTHLLDFVRHTMPGYRAAQHHRLICEKLEAVERGECPRLMIFTPPRHGKSELVSRRFPAWFLGRNPTREIISASYGSSLATDFGRDVRNIVASDEFAAVFPGVRLAPDSSAKNRWHTNHRGGYVAAGVGTGITGRGADILNIDDPVQDRAEAESEVTRKAVWAWYTSTAYTRLMPGGAVVITMTRWHQDDLAGRLLAEADAGGDRWEVIRLPAVAVANDDPLGRPVNAPLWPERYNAATLAGIRAAIGEREFGALYQQDPQPPGSTFFDIANVLVDGAGVAMPAICDGVFATMDTAVKTGTKNDGTGVAFWAISKRIGHPLILIDWEIVQIEGSLLEVWLPTVFDRLEGYARTLRARAGSVGVYVEDKASGTILLQQAKRRGWAAHEISSKLTAMGKDERAISVSGYVHRGMVKLAAQAHQKLSIYKGQSKNHLLSQVFGFRLGVKDQADDLLDTFCYGVAIALGNREGY
ncbi:MAG: terminase family protein [Acetobacteraceae bacterium]